MLIYSHQRESDGRPDGEFDQQQESKIQAGRTESYSLHGCKDILHPVSCRKIRNVDDNDHPVGNKPRSDGKSGNGKLIEMLKWLAGAYLMGWLLLVISRLAANIKFNKIVLFIYLSEIASVALWGFL